MKKAEFLNLIEDILEEDRGSYDGSESLEDVGWDSITFMSFITSVDTQLGLTLAPSDVVQCQTVDDLVKIAGDKIEG